MLANRVDQDQMPLSASDLGLHCLPMSLLCDARHKWVKDGYETYVQQVISFVQNVNKLYLSPKIYVGGQ